MNYKNVLLALTSIMAIFSSGCSTNQVVVESAREIPLAYDVEVVVYGATPGGISAEAAAAREGRSVLLVEHISYLGGLQNQYPYNQKHCLSYEICFPGALQTAEG